MSVSASNSDMSTVFSDGSISDAELTLSNSDLDSIPPSRTENEKRTPGIPSSTDQTLEKEGFKSDWAADHEKSIATNAAKLLKLAGRRRHLDIACDEHELGIKEDNEVIERLTQIVNNYQRRINLRTAKVQKERKRQKIRLGEKHAVAQEMCRLQTENIVLSTVRARARLELQKKAQNVDAVLYHVAPAPPGGGQEGAFDDPEWSRHPRSTFAAPDWARYAQGD